MRNSDRLAALNRVYGDPPGGLRINQTTELNGAIRGIASWGNIHRALSVLVGYTEDGQEIAGLAHENQHANYIRQLINRYGPETDNFPADVLGNLQAQIDGISQQVPIIVHVLKQMSPAPSESAFTVEFSGKLTLEEFQAAVADIGTVIDLLKIENDVSEVWTDFGSTVFGIDVGTSLSLVVLAAAIAGADQFRQFVAAFTPEGINTAFRLLDHLSRSILGNPLDPKIIESDDVKDLIKNFAGAEVTVPLTADVTNEQRNGLQLAIPRLAAMSDRGWQLSCSNPNIENSQISHSTIIVANTVNVALPAAPTEATGKSEA